MKDYEVVPIYKIPLEVRRKNLYESLIGLNISTITLKTLFLGLRKGNRLYSEDEHLIRSLIQKRGEHQRGS